jgi:hypothetical protein
MATWLNRIVEDFVNSLNFFVRGGMQDDDDGPDQADGASNLA